MKERNFKKIGTCSKCGKTYTNKYLTSPICFDCWIIPIKEGYMKQFKK